ncbi:aspartate phosphatase [Bacillus subtilis]|uniref:response regulator aspartate phosphatase n=1 Tax=Bacillus subtilis group TaxID=653685 RepID=UPI002DB5A868|nr:aspartate phosphatase [Bacillus subtilis]MEC3653262.1 aspartate phosphatase [Bacillus subtilis]
MEVIPSANVGLKINEWHMYINRFDVRNAEKVKAEVEQMIDVMEENQDLLIYYQLIEFRHRMMLDYLFPADPSKKINKGDYLKKIEGKGKKLSGMMEYYTYFFKGMYDFSVGEYIRAIQSYKKAEKKLTRVLDEIEKAEFYFKMAEVFYHMKQTHVSMYYVQQAYEIYKKHDTYKIHRIKCHFVIAGNYDDLRTHDRALSHMKKALFLLDNMEDHSPLKAKALLNMGNSYNQMGSLFSAVPFYHKAIEAAKISGAKEITQAYYDLALIHFRNNEKIEGRGFFGKAMEQAEEFNDSLFQDLLNVLKALFIETGSRQKVMNALEALRTGQGYPYFEELALIAAEFYTMDKRMEDSIYFYNEMVCAQRQIQRGDFLYEV